MCGKKLFVDLFDTITHLFTLHKHRSMARLVESQGINSYFHTKSKFCYNAITNQLTDLKNFSISNLNIFFRSNNTEATNRKSILSP